MYILRPTQIANNGRERFLIREIEQLRIKEIQICKEYENTIQELEEIIGIQQRSFLDLINNLEMEISRNNIIITQLGEKIEDLEFELNNR